MWLWTLAGFERIEKRWNAALVAHATAGSCAVAAHREEFFGSNPALVATHLR